MAEPTMKDVLDAIVRLETTTKTDLTELRREVADVRREVGDVRRDVNRVDEKVEAGFAAVATSFGVLEALEDLYGEMLRAEIRTAFASRPVDGRRV